MNTFKWHVCVHVRVCVCVRAFTVLASLCRSVSAGPALLLRTKWT